MRRMSDLKRVVLLTPGPWLLALEEQVKRLVSLLGSSPASPPSQTRSLTTWERVLVL